MAAHTWCLRFSASLLTEKANFFSICTLQIRQRRSGLRRNILRVLTPDEERRKLVESSGKSKSAKVSQSPLDYNNNTGSLKAKLHAVDQKFQSPASNNREKHRLTQKRVENETEFEYETLREKDDSRFGPVVMCAKSRKHREKKKEILLEGSRLIKDAVKAGAVLKKLFFSRAEALEGLPMNTFRVPVYKVQHHSLKLWSDLVTPPGIMGIFQMPNQGAISMERTDVIPVTLVCDNIRDPGNLGTIIRVGAAVGCERILCSKGCVDIWEPKVLRSGAGCHFQVPIINNLEWETLVSYFPAESAVCLADVGQVGQSGDYRSRVRAEDLRKLLEQSASGRAVTQHEDAASERDVTEGSDDLGTDSESDEGISLYEDKHTIALFRRLRLPSNVYHQVDFGGKSSVLVISNESEGPSPQAKKAVFDNYGQAVVVPMAMNVDSLNNSVAAGIILFEIKRQLTMKGK